AYRSLSDFNKAIEFYQLALRITKDTGDKDGEGTIYNNLGLAYRSLSDFNKAIEFYQLALPIAKDARNKDQEEAIYNRLGGAYYFLSDFKKAIEFYQLALRIVKDTGNKNLEAAIYTNLGLAYKSLSDFRKAIEFHQLALRIYKDTGNKDGEATVYNNLGLAYESLSNFNKAIEFHQLALRIHKDTGNKDGEATVYNNLGSAYYSLSDFNKAIEFHQLALRIAKDIGNKDGEGTIYNNLGLAYESLNDFNKAIDFHQLALRIHKDTGNKDGEATVYNNLGSAYQSLSDFNKAIEFYQLALRIHKDTGNKDREATVYNNLGSAYMSLSDFNKAIDDLETAMEFYKLALRITKHTGNKDQEATIYNNLGNAYHSLNNLQKADVECYQLALRIAKDTGNKYQEAVVYNNLGDLKQSLGEFNRAIELYEQSLRIAKDTGNKNGEGPTYINLGNVYRYLGDSKKAVEFYQLGRRIANETGNKDIEQRGYENLANVLWSLGNYSKAEKCFKSCIELVEEMRVLLEGNDEWKISFRNERDCVSRLVRLQLQQRKILEALLTADRRRAEALVDLLESQYGVRKSICSQPKHQMKLISNHISSPTLFQMNDTQSVNIWILLKGGKLYDFVQQGVSSDDLTSMIYQTCKQIGVNRSLWKNIRSRKEIEDQGDALKVLYDIFIAPFSQSIEGDELVIVPDGSSFLIPYAALMDQNTRYLSETLRIRLVPSLTSLRLLAECPEGRHSTSGALLVGNPWVETVRINRKPFRQLPGAEEEVKMIGQIIKIEPLTGKNATKDRVLSGLNSVSLVHIAAHGRTETGEIILSPNSPNFESAETPKEKDFLLTMADVLDAKVHAKLVVLSCCNSGRGNVKVEGVVGIARAFLGAGARSVIATLWEIDDEATLAFMRHFYEHLVAGQSASKSLHRAMKRMRESEKFNAVKHWAPFVLIGDDVTLNFGQ
ncbi:unnamed protein product, partial [Porites lobata]